MKIFLIVASGGEYDDAWSTNIGARYKIEDAEQEVARLKARDARITALVPELAELHSSLAQLPLELREIPRQPKWPKHSTKETMAAHRAAVDEWAKNAKTLLEFNQNLQNERAKKAFQATKELAISIGCNDEDLAFLRLTNQGFWHPCHVCEDCEYAIEEINLL